MGMYQVVWGTSNMWKLGLRGPHSWIQFCWRFTVEGSEREERSTRCRLFHFQVCYQEYGPKKHQISSFSFLFFRWISPCFDYICQVISPMYALISVNPSTLESSGCCIIEIDFLLVESRSMMFYMYICLITYMTLNSRFRTEKVRTHLCCFVFWPPCSLRIWIISVLIAERISRSEAKVQAPSWGDISGTRPAVSGWFL